MKAISTHDPVDFCEKFTRNILIDLKQDDAWNTWHPVMERLLNRTVEMKSVYEELCNHLGYSIENDNPGLRLSLEAILASGEQYNQDSISHKRQVKNELKELSELIPKLTQQLSLAITRQRELFNLEGFSSGIQYGIVEAIALAGKGNGHYQFWLHDELKLLARKYERKYWPKPEEVIAALGEIESSRPPAAHGFLSKAVLEGRSAKIKDFVLALDDDITGTDQIPETFSFSNSSMATIVNIVLDLEDNVITADNIRVIRNRRNNGHYTS